MSYAIHNQNLAFNDSAIAQYMNTDFIVIDISLCVALAREQFFEKLKDDDIPSHIFIEDNGRLAGLIAVRKLLQATDTVQPVKGLMISDFIQLKPEDERADVAGLLAHAGADVVPVVTHGKLVGCLTEREIAHLLEDDVTEDAQLQGDAAAGEALSGNQRLQPVEETLRLAAAAVYCGSVYQFGDPAF